MAVKPTNVHISVTTNSSSIPTMYVNAGANSNRVINIPAQEVADPAFKFWFDALRDQYAFRGPWGVVYVDAQRFEGFLQRQGEPVPRFTSIEEADAWLEGG